MLKRSNLNNGMSSDDILSQGYYNLMYCKKHLSILQSKGGVQPFVQVYNPQEWEFNADGKAFQVRISPPL